ncbi:MAG: NUDIX hydrolase [Gammaproteobacteria bacterium]|nr:NUDIX hydrolase [Gammaproteobacteria bacterium]
MIWKPHFTVAAIAEHQGRFLLVEEAPTGRTVLNQPAGHLDDNESLLDAVIRETHEETGHHFTPEYIVGVYRWQNPDDHKTFIRVAFFGSVDTASNPTPIDSSILQSLWLSKKAMTARKQDMRSPLVMQCIDDYQRGKRYALDLITDLG